MNRQILFIVIEAPPTRRRAGGASKAAGKSVARQLCTADHRSAESCNFLESGLRFGAVILLRKDEVFGSQSVKGCL